MPRPPTKKEREAAAAERLHQEICAELAGSRMSTRDLPADTPTPRQRRINTVDAFLDALLYYRALEQDAPGEPPGFHAVSSIGPQLERASASKGRQRSKGWNPRVMVWGEYEGRNEMAIHEAPHVPQRVVPDSLEQILDRIWGDVPALPRDILMRGHLGETYHRLAASLNSEGLRTGQGGPIIPRYINRLITQAHEAILNHHLFHALAGIDVLTL